MNRREFVVAAIGAASAFHEVQTYDVLITGGRVVDPSQNLSAVRDVAIIGTRIARIAPDIPRAAARHVIDARGKIVTPGLVDIHVHVYEGVTIVGIDADRSGVARGVTTVVDAGSAGATTFPAFRKYVVERAATRVYALLNISTIGLVSGNELADLANVNPEVAARAVKENTDVIVGIKVRMIPNNGPNQALEVLRRAKKASDTAGVPLMVHIQGAAAPLKDILALLRKGDVVTHVLRADGGILDAAGRVLPDVRAAADRGVLMDVGHGGGNFFFDVAEKALKQGWLPDTISSDLHSRSVGGPAFDLATTLSKFLLLGLTLEQVIERGTTNPAKAFRFPLKPGSLQEGSEADVTILNFIEGKFEFADSGGQKRTGRQKLEPLTTIKAGRVYRT